MEMKMKTHYWVLHIYFYLSQYKNITQTQRTPASNDHCKELHYDTLEDRIQF